MDMLDQRRQVRKHLPTLPHRHVAVSSSPFSSAASDSDDSLYTGDGVFISDGERDMTVGV